MRGEARSKIHSQKTAMYKKKNIQYMYKPSRHRTSTTANARHRQEGRRAGTKIFRKQKFLPWGKKIISNFRNRYFEKIPKK